MSKIVVAVVILLAVALLTLGLSAPAKADPAPGVVLAYPTPAAGPSYFTLHEDAGADDNWFARIEVENVMGSDDRTETVRTSKGDVVLGYDTSPGILPLAERDADDVCVQLLPDGVIAAPPCTRVLEGDTETIYLLLFTGG